MINKKVNTNNLNMLNHSRELEYQQHLQYSQYKYIPVMTHGFIMVIKGNCYDLWEGYGYLSWRGPFYDLLHQDVQEIEGRTKDVK